MANGLHVSTQEDASYRLPGHRRKEPLLQHASPSLSDMASYPPVPSYAPAMSQPYNMSILVGPPTCPLDLVLVDFMNARKSLLAGNPSSGSDTSPKSPEYPAFSVLVSPDLSKYSHPYSKLISDILRTFPDISRLPEQVAKLWSMFLLLRWQIEPTPEHYERIPDFLRPTEQQCREPHPAWIDYAPWPGMRDRMIAVTARNARRASTTAPSSKASLSASPSTVDTDTEAYPFEDFFIPYTTTFSVNWPGADHDVLVRNPAFVDGPTSARAAGLPTRTLRSAALDTPPDTVRDADEDECRRRLDEWIINPAFEAHVRRLENWSLGPAFARAWPALTGLYRLRK